MSKAKTTAWSLARYGVKTPNEARLSAGTKKTTAKEAEEARDVLSQYRQSLDASDAQYDAELDALRAQKEEARRRAAVSQTLLDRYAPATKGLEGQGVAQTAAIEEKNAYQRTLGQIERDFAAEERELGSARAKEQATLRKYYGELLREDQDKLYETTLERIQKERFGTLADLDAILAEVESLVRPEQYAALKNAAVYFRGNPNWQ